MAELPADTVRCEAETKRTGYCGRKAGWEAVETKEPLCGQHANSYSLKGKRVRLIDGEETP